MQLKLIFLVHKMEVENLILSLYLKFNLACQIIPGINSSQKRRVLTTKLMSAIIIIQNIEHSYIAVARK